MSNDDKITRMARVIQTICQYPQEFAEDMECSTKLEGIDGNTDLDVRQLAILYEWATAQLEAAYDRRNDGDPTRGEKR